MLKGVLALALLMICSRVASAQPPSDETQDSQIPDVLWSSVERLLGPEDLGMSQLKNTAELYSELVAPGRCGAARKAAIGQPCAFISYVPLSAEIDAYANTLRPVFRVVSSERVWTVIEGKLARVNVRMLEAAHDFQSPNGEKSEDAFPAIAVVGLQENMHRCDAGLNCIDMTYYVGLIGDVRVLSPGCVDEIWNGKSGPTGAGSQAKCKYVTDRSFVRGG